MKAEQQIQKKYGDFKLLGEILGISAAAARMRYNRNDESAVKAMALIHKSRIEVIETYNKRK